MFGFIFIKFNLIYCGLKIWWVDDGFYWFVIKFDKIFFQYFECMEECYFIKVCVKNGNVFIFYECIWDVEVEGDFDFDVSNDGFIWIFDIIFGDIEFFVFVEEICQVVMDRKD